MLGWNYHPNDHKGSISNDRAQQGSGGVMEVLMLVVLWVYMSIKLETNGSHFNSVSLGQKMKHNCNVAVLYYYLGGTALYGFNWLLGL